VSTLHLLMTLVATSTDANDGGFNEIKAAVLVEGRKLYLPCFGLCSVQA
jgi:hypothetical protein